MIATPTQQKWLAKLLGYVFVVEYKNRVDNKVINAFSRKFESTPKILSDQLIDNTAITGCLCLLLVLDPTLLSILKDSYSQDVVIQQIIHFIQSSASPNGFTLQNDLLLYKGRFYLGSMCPLKTQILHHVHSSPLVGHSEFLKSYQRAKREFFWHSMKIDLKRLIKECDVCKRVKSKNTAPIGFLAFAHSYYSQD